MFAFLFNALAWNMYLYVFFGLLTRFVFVILVYRQGAQGIHDTASKAILHSEFGTEDKVACIQKILEKGEVQETEVRTYPYPYPRPCLSFSYLP